MAWRGRRWDISNQVRVYADTLPFTDRERVRGVVHAKDQSPVHHILRIFDLYVLCALWLVDNVRSLIGRTNTARALALRGWNGGNVRRLLG
jgi:hypothetical protein